MAQAKQKSQPSGKDTASSPPRADSSAAQGHKPETPGPGGLDMSGRLDRFGNIVGKGFDLAEAGISLGITILGKVGAIAEKQIRERMETTAPYGAAPTAAAQQPGAWPAAGAGAPALQTPQEQAYCITNRLPLVPGGSMQIPFSINNDSMVLPKKVDIRVEGFVGDTQGASISSEQFKVTPAQATIAPVDFEKFVLQGTLPLEAPSDVYRGRVVVASDTELSIPVVLVAMPH